MDEWFASLTVLHPTDCAANPGTRRSRDVVSSAGRFREVSKVVSKTSFLGVSLVGAVPAGLLTYFLVMAFMNHAETMGTTLQALCLTSAGASALVALCPIIVLVGYTAPVYGKPIAVAGAAPAEAEEAALEEVEEEWADEEGFDEVDDEFGEIDDDTESLDEIHSDAELGGAEFDDADLSETIEADAFDEDFDDFEDLDLEFDDEEELK